ncbi:unnamed protein product, partial [Hapterophycus canaliculatus]
MEKVSTGGNDRPRLPVTIDDCGQVGEMVDEEDRAEGAPNSMGQAEGAAEGVTGIGEDEAGRNEAKGEEDAKAKQEEEEEEEEEEEALEEPDEETLGRMSSMEQRLFKIRLKMNKGRRANKKAVKDEYNRLSDPGYAAKMRSKEKEEAKKRWEAEMKDRGLSKDEAFMVETAQSAEIVSQHKQKKDKHKAAFG